MTINFASKTIEMTKTESKAAGKFGTEAYKELTTILQQFPNYTIHVVTRPTTKKASSLKGLTYDYMEAYITKYDDEAGTIMAEYLMLRGKNEAAEEALATSCSYLEMKAWFLAKFPAVEEFHKQRKAILATAK